MSTDIVTATPYVDVNTVVIGHPVADNYVTVTQDPSQLNTLTQSMSVVRTATQVASRVELREVRSIEVVSLLNQGPEGLPGLNTGDERPQFDEQVDAASSTVVYRAEAPLGSDPDAAVWRIRRITLTYQGQQVMTESKWAGNDRSFSRKWTNRYAYTY